MRIPPVSNWICFRDISQVCCCSNVYKPPLQRQVSVQPEWAWTAAGVFCGLFSWINGEEYGEGVVTVTLYLRSITQRALLCTASCGYTADEAGSSAAGGKYFSVGDLMWGGRLLVVSQDRYNWPLATEPTESVTTRVSAWAASLHRHSANDCTLNRWGYF